MVERDLNPHTYKFSDHCLIVGDSNSIAPDIFCTRLLKKLADNTRETVLITEDRNYIEKLAHFDDSKKESNTLNETLLIRFGYNEGDEFINPLAFVVKSKDFDSAECETEIERKLYLSYAICETMIGRTLRIKELALLCQAIRKAYELYFAYLKNTGKAKDEKQYPTFNDVICLLETEFNAEGIALAKDLYTAMRLFPALLYARSGVELKKKKNYIFDNSTLPYRYRQVAKLIEYEAVISNSKLINEEVSADVFIEDAQELYYSALSRNVMGEFLLAGGAKVNLLVTTNTYAPGTLALKTIAPYMKYIYAAHFNGSLKRYLDVYPELAEASISIDEKMNALKNPEYIEMRWDKKNQIVFLSKNKEEVKDKDCINTVPSASSTSLNKDIV